MRHGHLPVVPGPVANPVHGAVDESHAVPVKGYHEAGAAPVAWPSTVGFSHSHCSVAARAETCVNLQIGKPSSLVFLKICKHTARRGDRTPDVSTAWAQSNKDFLE